MKVVITSKNPVKVDAVKSAFEIVLDGKLDFEDLDVSSDVDEQPFNEETTLSGAYNRIDNAKHLIKAEFYVAIESGVVDRDGELGVFSWVVVENNGLFGKARSSEFYLPAKMKELLDRGLTLGQAGDSVFGGKDTNKKGGTVSFLTKGSVTREQVTCETVKLALIPFISKEFYSITESSMEGLHA